MCGIAAIIGASGTGEEDSLTALGAIKHRGEPEHFNEHEVFPGAVLAMNRLAIVDRAAGTQPKVSFDGKYHCIANAEIYNYKELKQELEALGATFTTDSDTEVIVNAYAVWKEAMVEKIRGMFAFVIYDPETGDFFAARDHIGIKPLYFAKDANDVHYFASEIKALVPLGQIEEVQVFPAGHFMKNGALTKYWSFPTTRDYSLTEEACIEKIRTLFDAAIKSHIDTDLPVAVYMSGGIDSTAVLATAVKYHNNVTAIIMGNDSSEDKKVALQYCNEFGIPYKIKVPPPETDILANDIPATVHTVESFEPNVIRSSTLSRYLAKAAADEGYKVILCGEGSDEIFAGYLTFSFMKDYADIEKTINDFVGDLYRTQCQRVDRTSMEVTTEVRVPFLDREFMEFALQIPAEFKVDVTEAAPLTKAIFRKAMQDRLPEYIYNRTKVVLNAGAGYSDNRPQGNLFVDTMSARLTDEEFEQLKKDYPEWNLATKEEAYYFTLFKENGYTKATFNQKRTMVNKDGGWRETRPST